MMHGLEKSDPSIVAAKPTNKAGKPAAEPVEPREGAKGNTHQQRTRRAQDRESVSQVLARVRKAARSRKTERFTSLLHHLDSPGGRVKDAVEVASQAVRSARWKWRFKDLCRHVVIRDRRLAGTGRPSRFLAGRPTEVKRSEKLARLKEVRAEIAIVQPGLSRRDRTPDQETVLAAAASYLKQTVGVDLRIFFSL